MRRDALSPPITLTTDNYEHLVRLAAAAEQTMPDVSDYLAEELDRATVVAPEKIARGVVTMYSTVAFRDEQSKQVRVVTLVYPKDENITEGKLSVMTPVGAALVGLTEGQSITWHTRAGQEKVLTVLTVEHQPEAEARNPS